MRLVSLKLFPTLRRSIYKRTQQQCSTWLEPEGFMTNIKVYNPITKSKVPLILKKDGIATWYMCGPTVYDSAHIGHACTFVRFDIIRRILSQFFNINVITAMSITDIDDKIIQRSLGSKRDWKELTKSYEKEFFEDMEFLNVVPPYLYCRVTDYIPQIIHFVGKILATNSAYIGKDGSVYFDTKKYDKYGKLYKALPSEEHSIKNSTNDFALWKASKPGEPFWESPWGNGRPGWHIECSTIASTIFGCPIDIHSGGIDLLFPHHENEEAQSCCYHAVDQWVNYWLHSGHLYLSESQKMSKSLKNTVSVRDLLKTYSSNQFRLFCLLTHYRTGIEFSNEKMHGAIRILQKLENFLSDCQSYVSGRLIVAYIDENLVIDTLQNTKKKVYSALTNDFDTRSALAAIEELITVVNKMLRETEASLTISLFVQHKNGFVTCFHHSTDEKQ
ncbi:probable cysteine--tRNA ligase, mitochondrial isoform X2 [Venturia canescens]|uniref:probable cysteine--tRNA ligase, mitochondrial isoform X2 n=1 Tax=Venturia canescens TaxID=32260 RepID=UPI001C9CB311|nr:probable cysteine--tRNA ligase, mitochondrial isoform X2 [Venturia canescens]